MRMQMIRRPEFGLASCAVGMVLLLVPAATASAGMVLLNPGPEQYVGELWGGAIVAHARFRVDNNNWDLLLDRDRSPGNGNDLGQANLGNISAISGFWHRFRLGYSPAGGFVFEVTNQQAGNGRVLSWSGPSPAFNALRLESRAAGTSTMEVGLEFLDLAWTVGGPHGVQGALGGLDVWSPVNGPSVTIANWVLADFDLSTVEWEVTGLMKPAMAGFGNPQERLRLYLDVMNVPAVPVVPEPLAAVLLGAGTLALLAMRRLRSGGGLI